MIATVAVFTTSITLHNYSFFSVVGIIKFYSLSKFHDSSTILLSIFIILCIRPLWFIYYSLHRLIIFKPSFSLLSYVVLLNYPLSCLPSILSFLFPRLQVSITCQTSILILQIDDKQSVQNHSCSCYLPKNLQ